MTLVVANAKASDGHGPALLDYEQLSEWLNDTVRHLRRLVDEDRIPYIKVGHFVRFDPAAIADWLVANRRGTWA
jgi:excisionase family DNA binding protein